jgi:hypothetical protein
VALADDLNEALADAREFETAALERAYEIEVRRAAREISAAFLSLVAAASWVPPTVEEVTNWSVSMARIRGAQRNLMGRIAQRMSAVPGVDFSLTQPVVQRLLNQLAVRAEETIREGVRGPVAHAIARAWAEGRTIPQTARAIQEAVGGTADYKATMLARTDKIGLSNGAGQAAVTKLNESARRNGEEKPIGSKTWTNAGDSRVRETHQEAEGQTVPIDEPYRVGGASLSYPGDPFGPSEEVLNCRCVEIFNEAVRPARQEEKLVEQPEAGIPFSKALDVKPGVGGGRLPGIDRAVSILEKVLPRGLPKEGKHAQSAARYAAHFDDEYPGLQVVPEKLDGAFGEYRFAGPAPVKISIDPRLDAHHVTTTLHEVGHWLDHRELWDEVGWAIEAAATPETKAFVRATRSSAAWKQMQPLPNMQRIQVKGHQPGETPMYVTPSTEGRAKIKAYVHDYLMTPEEVWARAFAQWATRKSGDPVANRELDETIRKGRTPEEGFYAVWDQWDDDDFAPIGEAIEALLRSRGMLDDELTAAGFRVYLSHVPPRLLAPVERGDVLDRLFAGDPKLAGERVDDLVVGHAGLAEVVRSHHAAQPSAASYAPFAAVPSPESEIEEVAVPAEVEVRIVPVIDQTRDGEVLRVYNEATGEDVTDQYSKIEDEAGRIVGFAAEPQPVVEGGRWHSDVAFEGVPTGDGRIMLAGSLDWREVPLTLMAMIETTEGGHLGAQISGRMDSFEKRDRSMDGAKLAAGTRSVYSTGAFDTGAYGVEIERMVSDETLRGISVDLSVSEWAFYDPENGDVIDPAEATDEQWEKAFMGDLDFAVVKGTILAATVCPTPAFADARIALAASGRPIRRPNVWRAGAAYAVEHGLAEGTLMTTLHASIDFAPRTPVGGDTILAAGYGRAPVAPPFDWFVLPEADEPTPLTVEEDGRVYGHLCLWDSCHVGFLNGQFSECVKPPRSAIGYADFHLGGLPVEGENGPEILAVGHLTVDTGHADPAVDRVAARAHYDHTGAVAAFVRAIDGKHGVWVSGSTRSNATDEQIRDLCANPPSGDWRGYQGNLELQAALAVVVPGFPVPRAQLALSASGEPMTLILPSNVAAPALPPVLVDYVYSPDVLAASIDGTLDDLIQSDDCGCA